MVCLQLDVIAARIQFVNPGRAMQPLLQPRCRIVGGAASAIVSGSIKGKRLLIDHIQSQSSQPLVCVTLMRTTRTGTTKTRFDTTLLFSVGAKVCGEQCN